MMNHIDRGSPSEKNGVRHRISFGGLIAFLNSLGTGWIFVLLMLINTDIIGRTVFDKPVRGVAEIVGMTIVGCVFLQLAYAIRNDRLTRSEIILARLTKYPQFKYGLEAVYNLLGALILAVLFFYSIPMLTNAWATDEFIGAEGDFMAPVWPMKLIIVVGSLLAAVQCLLNCYKSLWEMRRGRSRSGGKQRD
jgi:TRAP-type mannitol/chloroaromatic compound transport system permease small subunit